jgi:hypothetical protein
MVVLNIQRWSTGVQFRLCRRTLVMRPTKRHQSIQAIECVYERRCRLRFAYCERAVILSSHMGQ